MLENLNVGRNYLGEVDSELMGGAVARMKTVSLRYTYLKSCQATAIFQAILSQEDLKLENLNVGGNDLGEVNSELMGGAVARIKMVSLRNTSMETSQATAIFQAILSQEDLELEDLNVSDNDLGEVDSELMGAVVARIKAVDLTDISLNSSQVTDICHAIQAADEELELEDLRMPMMVEELSQVDNDLLAGAVVRIRDVNMITDSPLSKAQTTTIFHAILAEKAGLIILI